MDELGVMDARFPHEFLGFGLMDAKFPSVWIGLGVMYAVFATHAWGYR